MAEDGIDAHEATRERVLFVALRIVAEEGAQHLRLRRVAAEAGVTTGALYHHFGSKDGLIRAVAERYTHEVVTREAQARRLSPLDQLDRVTGWLADAASADDWRRHFGQAASELLPIVLGDGDQDGRFAPGVREPFERALEEGTFWPPPGVSSDVVVDVAAAAVIGVVRASAEPGFPHDPHVAVAAVVAMLRHGLAADHRVEQGTEPQKAPGL
jgi:AcrR family transcriptional regulator